MGACSGSARLKRLKPVPETKHHTLTLRDGTRLYVADRGKGTPILALHGVPEDHTSFSRLVPLLEDRVRFIMPDMRGFGESLSRPRFPRLDPEVGARDVSEVVEQLALHHPVILGHDVGGYVAMEYLQRAPYDVRGVILINTTYRRIQPSGSPHVLWLGLPFIGPFVMMLMGPGVARLAFKDGYADTTRIDQEHLEHCKELLTKPPTRQAILEIYRFAVGVALDGLLRPARLEEDLRRLDVPGLIIWGMKDPFLPKDTTEWLQKLLPASQVIPMNQQGHFPHQEDPASVATAIDQFLGEIEHGRASSAA